MINKKRIRKLNPYRHLLPTTDTAYVMAVGLTETQLSRAGFAKDVPPGTTILPAAVGRVTLFNAEGKERVCRDQPMETAFRTVEWHWTEWHGKDTVEKSDFRDVPYKRYPREFIAPPAIELTFVHDTEGKLAVISEPVLAWKTDEESLIHVINVFLELFGECIILDESKKAVFPHNIQRVNWKVLPKGEYPFERVMTELKPVLEKIKRGKRSFVDKRLERLNTFEPAFAVMGLGGFSGYVIMAYPDRNLYVLESLLYGNATYVLTQNWESVSKLTKAQILNNQLHKDRIIHRQNWFSRIKDQFRD